MNVEDANTIADLCLMAARRLPRPIFEFICGGADDEATLDDNVNDFNRWRLIPRIGVDVHKLSTTVSIIEKTAAMPLIFAPTGLSGLYFPNGEVESAKAAAAADIPFCLSTNSVASIEEVAKRSPGGDKWFQLYMLRDHQLMIKLLDRARDAGFRVLCLTLDLSVQGRRLRDIRNAFTVPLRIRPRTLGQVLAKPAWLAGYLRAPVRFGNFDGFVPAHGFTDVAQHVGNLFDPSADWTTIAQIIDYWSGPVAFKGILHPDDAKRAADLGAAAIIVSNHGGRQLGQARSSITALPDIVRAVGERTDIILDGGVRTGIDLIKARALGARACMVGRPFLWGLSVAGELGVSRAIKIFEEELNIALALLGQPEFDEITAEYLIG